MKKIYFLLMLSVMSAGVFAQSYYLLPYLNAGINPGNLHSDGEYPVGGGLPTGWSVVMSTTTTDQWSSIQTIPFNFDFNGQLVSSYKVSNTGVLTFSTSAVSSPSDANTALPSPLLPDNSVCVWGLNIGNSGDNIVKKTFGTAPNRQHWITFSSASEAGIPTGWSYWSIVLEESTNNIYIVDQRTQNGNVTITVGIQVDLTNAVQVSASPNVASLTTGAADPSDNTFYEFIYGTQLGDDIKGIASATNPVVKTNTAASIKGVFRNLGLFTASSVNFNYSVNGGVPVTASVNANMTTGEVKTLTHPSQWTPATDGVYTLKMWLSSINGNPDEDNANDTITVTISALTSPPVRKVVIEEKTGTWCGWCPRGLVGMEHMTSTYPNTVIGIAVHNGDPMVVSGYDGNAYIGLVAPGGYPGSAVDRILGPDPNISDLEDAYNERQDVIPLAEVSIDNLNYNSTTSQIDVTVGAEFYTDYTNSDLRFLLVITEDSVTGTNSQYGQVNYYSSSSQNLPLTGYGRNWQTSPSVVPASEMYYDHVARAIHPSFFGEANSVPVNITFGQTVSHNFTMNLPLTIQNPKKVHVVAMLVNNSTYEVLNADQVDLASHIGLEEATFSAATIYPNPASDYVIVEHTGHNFSVEVINSIGQSVANHSFFNAEKGFINTASFTPGVYILKIVSDNETSSARLIIK